jgi:hypothetical protein
MKDERLDNLMILNTAKEECDEINLKLVALWCQNSGLHKKY